MLRHFGVAAALVLGAAPALAQSQDCGRLGPVLDLDNRAFATLSWQMAPSRGVTADAGGAPTGLPPAKECTLSSEEGTNELTCQWEYAAQGAATAAFDGLLARMRRCLGADSMPSGTIFASANSWRPVQRNEHAIERGNGTRTDIALQLVEYIAQGQPGAPPPAPAYYVELTVTRDED